MECKILASSPEDKDWIAEQLIAFNRRFLPSSREDYIIPLNFHFRDSKNNIVAGINAFVLSKSTVYVDMLWVDDKHRGKNYGSALLLHVEKKAKKLGAKLIHLDTYDFQAREFYIKCGYTEFALLEDSPAIGRKRFYMKKYL